MKRKRPLLDLIEKEARRSQKSRQQLLNELIQDNREYKKGLVDDTRKRIKKNIKDRRIPSVGVFSGESKVDTDEFPLWWPKGSVRAVIALWMTIGYLLITMLVLALIVWYPSLGNLLFEIWKMLTYLEGIILGGYFYSRFKMAVLNGRNDK